jgi:hypothetical protein
MIRWIFAAMLMITGTGPGAVAEEIDRLLAAVNGKVVTDGDLKMARSLNALILLGRTDATPSPEQELSRLIDLELIRQEMENFPIAAAGESGLQSEVQSQLEGLRNAYAEIGGLPALLRTLGLQESELISYLRLRELMKRFMNLRFRPFLATNDPAESEKKLNAAMDQWIENIRAHSRIEIFRGIQQAAGSRSR